MIRQDTYLPTDVETKTAAATDDEHPFAHVDTLCDFLAGLARTLFMEDRSAYGTSVDIPTVAAQLPTVAQLQALTQHGSEYAVAVRGGRALSLRLQPAAEPLPRRVSASCEQTGFVSGGAKVTFCVQEWRGARCPELGSVLELPYIQRTSGLYRTEAARGDAPDLMG